MLEVMALQLYLMQQIKQQKLFFHVNKISNIFTLTMEGLKSLWDLRNCSKEENPPVVPSKIVTTTFPAVVIILPIISFTFEAIEAILRSSFNFVVSSDSSSPCSASSKSSYINASSASSLSPSF